MGRFRCGERFHGSMPSARTYKDGKIALLFGELGQAFLESIWRPLMSCSYFKLYRVLCRYEELAIDLPQDADASSLAATAEAYVVHAAVGLLSLAKLLTTTDSFDLASPLSVTSP